MASSGAVNLQQIQEAMHNLLNSREQNEFLEVLNDFHARRNVHDFAFSLKVLLDTPAKQQLAALVRRVIPKKDVHLFDQNMNGYESNSFPSRSLGKKKDPGTVHKAGSTMSVPARYYQTLPQKGAKTIRRQTSSNPDEDKTLNLPNWEAGIIGDVKKILMDAPTSPKQGLGFSIRGGAEHGIGIYVSYVDVNSTAEKRGLVPGDQILSVNGVTFHKIPHGDAAKVIKSAKHLEIEVRNVGRVPGSFETHQTYTWVDPVGRTVSPPPEVDHQGRYDPTGVKRSGLMLLKDSDERKVNVHVTDVQPLGLMIRGGNEFGLGIYVTGVDKGSTADHAGLKVGDQILDVNGQSFLDISHADAVKTIKSSKHMMFTIKDVGKLPYARTTYDHTQWITGQRLGNKQMPNKSPSSRRQSSEPVFMRGAGSQLMHNSVANQQTQKGMIDEQARQLLNENEHGTMNYYLSEYIKGTVNVESLILALSELFNTQAKYSMMPEIRGMIVPKDIEKFDALLMEREVEEMKAPCEVIDGISVHSYDDTLSTTSRVSSVSKMSENGESDPLQIAIEQISESAMEHHIPEIHLDKPHISAFKPVESVKASTSMVNNVPVVKPMPLINGSPPQKSPGGRGSKAGPNGITKNSPNRTDLPANSNMVVTEVQVHAKPASPKQKTKSKVLYQSLRSPSEDSGVELNGNNSNGESQNSNSSNDNRKHIYEHNWSSMDMPSKTNGKKKRVTMSSQEPVIINEVLNEPASQTDVSSQEEEILFHRQLNDWDISPKMGRKTPHVKKERSPRVSSREMENGISHRSRRDRSRERSPSVERRNYRNDHSPSGGRRDRSSERSPKAKKSPNNTAPTRTEQRSPKSKSKHKTHRSNSRDRDSSRGYQDNHGHYGNGSHTSHGYSSIKEPLYSAQRDTIYGFHGNNRNNEPGYDTLENNLMRKGDSMKMDLRFGRNHVNTKEPLYMDPRRPGSPYGPHGNTTARLPMDYGTSLVDIDLPDGEIELLTIYKTKPTLGIAIEGGANTKQPIPRIISIQPGGSAHESGGLRVGHVLLEINGKSLRGLEHQRCARTIAEAFKNKNSTQMDLLVLDPSLKNR